MFLMNRRIFFVMLILALPIFGFAQNIKELKAKIGDKYFRNMSYVQAIATYEDVLKEDSFHVGVWKKLAISYLKVHDMKAAEKMYGMLVKQAFADSGDFLAYAQVLAVTKNYSESQRFYEMLSLMCPSDSRARAFAAAYNDSTFFTQRTNNIITIANFNSEQSDFGPAFYKSGLIFASNRTVSTMFKRTFDWDLSSFLDLYFVKDTGSIQFAPKIDTLQGSSKRRKLIYNDDDTRFTSNDTKTMSGFISQKYIDTVGTFTTSPFLIEGFSKAINSKFHEGPVCFTKDQKTIIFTRNSYYRGRTKKTKDGVNNLRLFKARFNGKEWGNVEQLNLNSNVYSVGHPALSLNDSILYFVSDMPGGIGGTDIYKSRLNEKGKWGTPENLGRPINTEGNELFPYIDVEGTFYFSSNGHPGFGGLDIFRTSLETIDVKNLGQPINSNEDDFGIALDASAREGFISSSRRRSYNDDDIYIVSIPKPAKYNIRVVDSITEELIPLAEIGMTSLETADSTKIEPSETGSFTAYLWHNSTYALNAKGDGHIPGDMTLKTDPASPVITIKLRRMLSGCIVAGTILDKDSRLPIAGAHIIIYDKTDEDSVYKFVVSDDGKYRYPNLKANHNYAMEVFRDGYFTKPSSELNTFDNKCLFVAEREYDYLRDFELEKIVIGKAIKIENIYFDLAKYNIRKSAAIELDKIVKMMQDNPDIIIELSSHTDCRASFVYNMTLSDHRAKSSAAYIISKSIAKERITGKGYGETKLVNDCACEGKVISRPCTEEEHQANRRTEFQVTGFLSDKNNILLQQPVK